MSRRSIMTPQEFVGNIMPMCQDRRGIFKDVQYLDSNLVELHYEMRPVRLFMTFSTRSRLVPRGMHRSIMNYRLSQERSC